jgi:hypothetical protein
MKRIVRVAKCVARVVATAAAWTPLVFAQAPSSCKGERGSPPAPIPPPSGVAPVVGSDTPAGKGGGTGDVGLATDASPRPGAATPLVMQLMPLIEAGRPPRHKLRYAWRTDQKESLVIDMQTAAATEAAGAKQPDLALPSVHIAIAIDPRGVSPEGDLGYAWHVTSATVGAANDTPSQVAEGMRAEVAAIGGLSGTAVITARGLTREVTVTGEPLGKVGQMVEQVRQTLRDVAAPFPEEDVGVGARWKKLTQIDDRDERIAQTETFRLAAVDGDKGTLDDSIAQTAPPQALRALGMPPDTHARMESMLGSGRASVRFALSRVVPQTSYDSTTTMVVSGGPGGHGTRDVTMVMRLSVTLAGSLR